jgi:hypothetical protein
LNVTAVADVLGKNQTDPPPDTRDNVKDDAVLEIESVSILRLPAKDAPPISTLVAAPS